MNSHSPVKPIARMDESRYNIIAIVQTPINSRRINLHVRMLLMKVHPFPPAQPASTKT
ncbi:hypothetical protein [Microcoleus sp.]|uniref:hypothetical protein n=1 Tax=Microcoleus sp. TaxID=44472 RepID=UPI003C789A3B